MKQRFALVFTVILIVITALPIAAAVIVTKNRQEAMKNEEPAFDEAGSDLSAPMEDMEAGESFPGADDDISGESHEDITGPSEHKDTSDEEVPADTAGVLESGPIDVLPPPPPLEKYNDLLAVNPYLAGWLEIDGTRINDPVVYTPGSQNYFLHRSLDGTPSERGTFFIAINWQEGFNNTLIYGHNMSDGSGFGSLTAFADASYGLSHPVIRFDTLYEDREYELYAAFYSQIDEEELETEDDRAAADKRIEERSVAKKQEEAEAAAEAGEEPPPVIDPSQFTVADLDLHRDFGYEDIFRAEKDDDRGRFRYYYYTDLADRDDFEYFARNVKERALYDTGVDAAWGDEFVTLSTCSYQVKNGRFVVVGVRHTSD
ncbi:MAG: class B sortase [Lachnospiraceae bacterium]|nr:class B sortase [Lachnospiraceae bacterium]